MTTLNAHTEILPPPPHPPSPLQNVRGTIGLPTPGTEIRVVDPETLSGPLPDGEAGLLLARGPGVMRGYLEDSEATAQALRAGDGWFDTGKQGGIGVWGGGDAGV